MTGRFFSISLFALLALGLWNPAFAGVTASFRYPLSNFSGPVPSQWAKLAVDQERGEVYALNQRANDIRIFDEHGMEIFVFGDGYSTAADIAIGEDGDIFILSTGYQTSTVHLLNYRGEHVSEIPLQNIPDSLSEFVADRLIYRQQSLYLVDSGSLLVIVVDEEGLFKEAHDLKSALKPALDREKRKQKAIEDSDWKQKALEYVEVNGFTVDSQGNMFFTVPVLFLAFRLSPGGELVEFGRAGSGPGKFGVVAGIAVDEMGYIYVADRLRSVVLVFDPSFQFQTEFGYRGDRPSSLMVPDDLAIDREGNVYVGQAANRGVSVFRVVREAAVHEEVFQEAVVDKAIFQEAVVQEAAAPEAAIQQAPVKEVEVHVAVVREEEVDQEAVQETTSPSQGSDTTSRDFEESGQVIEEDVPDEVESIVDLSDQVEFIVDQGGDTPSTDSGKSGWTIEEDESDRLEETRDEE
jgi:DNA-binding beta-propeller fold protein YncE